MSGMDPIATPFDLVAMRLEAKIDQTERMLKRWITGLILVAGILGFVAGRFV